MTPTRRLEILLHGYAVGNAADRAEGQRPKPWQSTNVIADHR
jgi:hypothetical protein